MTKNTISFNNFKAFGEKMQTFSKKPITLIYGPNSVGKSSFLHSQLLLEYLKMSDPNLSVKKTSFAGDEIDFGGFENFIHKHDTTKNINYEVVFTNPDDFNILLTNKYLELIELQRNEFFDRKISNNEVNIKLESDYENSGIKFKYLLKYILFYNKISSEMKLGSSLLDLDIKTTLDWENKSQTVIELCTELKTLTFQKAMLEYWQGHKSSQSNDPLSTKEVEYFTDLFNAQLEKLQNTNDDLEKAILLSEHENANDIATRFQFYKYLLSIENIMYKIELSMEPTYEHKITTYINNEILFSYDATKEQISINKKHDIIQEFLKLSSKIRRTINDAINEDFYQHSSEKAHSLQNDFNQYNDIDFSLQVILEGIFYKDSTIQYFGPLRPYPERWEMFSVAPIEVNLTQEQNNIKSGKQFVTKVQKFKYLPFFMKFIIIMFNKNGRKFLRQNSTITDLWNTLLPKKFEFSGINTSNAKSLWVGLTASEDIQSSINNWLQNISKLKSLYSIQTKKYQITRLELFGRYFEKLFGLEARAFGNRQWRAKKPDILEKIVRKAILLSKYIEKKLTIAQRYENELIFTDISSNTTVTPKDMGLGISQLLPILISTLSFKNTSLYLEQPELHLHPSVQSELADEFIRSSKEQNNTFMIETHSEHLLLRIMKRMRHTAENKPDRDKTLDLTPDDVCLLYVDNNGETTYINELELDEDGALLDPWPNGFFEEGHKERFE